MKKYENFCNAFHNLKDIYDYNEPYTNVEMSGLVALYEICFEQAWKAMKEILEQQGFAEERTGSLIFHHFFERCGFLNPLTYTR